MQILEEFVSNHFPRTKNIVLAVNSLNENAHQLYVKAGYRNTGKVLDGLRGLQYVLSKEIKL